MNSIKNSNPHHIRSGIRSRVYMLCAVFFIASLAIIVQILTTQYGPNGEALRNLSKSRTTRSMTVQASRGNILSEDGYILSTDSPNYTIRLDLSVPSLTDSIFKAKLPALADSMSKMTGKSSASYRTQLSNIRRKAVSGAPGGKDQLFISRVNQIELDRLKRFPIFDRGRWGGFMAIQDNARFSPYANLASYTIGKRETHGLENAYNSVLSGKDGRNMYVRLVGNVWLPIVDTINREVVNGMDVVTTINTDIQDVTETALRKQLGEQGALTGTAIVMEVKTGKIRALSNLTHYASGTIAADNNYATNQTNEPGSTFKLVSLLALLDQCGMSVTDSVDCSATGYAVVNGAEVRDTHHVGTVTVQEMMAESSNVGFARMIFEHYKNDPQKFVDYIDKLGINRPAYIQNMKGRAPTILSPKNKGKGGWNGYSLVKMSYGYVNEFSPLHILMLYNAVANGGKMISPIIVSEIRDGSHTVEEFRAEVINPQICSKSVLEAANECLKDVVEHGTATILKNDNYVVAGKTGTAQAYNSEARGYITADGGRDYLGTLVGYFPADDPKYTCIVAIKTHTSPKNPNTYYGAALAGPVFKAIADRIYALDKEWQEPLKLHSDKVEPIKVKGGDVDQIKEAAHKVGIKRERSHHTEWAVSNTTDSNQLFKITDAITDQGVMPNVVGMGLKDAIYILESHGLRVNFTGKGGVKRQSIPAGRRYTKGNTVTLTLTI